MQPVFINQYAGVQELLDHPVCKPLPCHELVYFVDDIFCRLNVKLVKYLPSCHDVVLACCITSEKEKEFEICCMRILFHYQCVYLLSN